MWYFDDFIDVGLIKFVYNGVYKSCYLFYEGEDEIFDGEIVVNLRQQLKRDWVRFGRIFKYQLYDVIKDYFGYIIGLYFVWFGFYIVMLVFFVIFVLIVFIYGIVFFSFYILVCDFCSESN